MLNLMLRKMKMMMSVTLKKRESGLFYYNCAGRIKIRCKCNSDFCLTILIDWQSVKIDICNEFIVAPPNKRL